MSILKEFRPVKLAESLFTSILLSLSRFVSFNRSVNVSSSVNANCKDRRS